jgi:hypothetical protein
MDDGPPMQDRRRSRLARLAGFGLLAIASSVAAVSLFLPLAVRVFVRAIELTVSACVRLATSLSVGVSVWTVLRVIARNAVTLMTSRGATALLMGLVLIGVAAAYGLQRILGSEEESL